jgi:colanic acid/amylovoran biosynthesis glycosyltransferase
MTGATPSDVESGARPEPVGGTVVIFRSAMLAGSETFIRNQGMALTRWRPAFLGAVKVTSDVAADTDAIAFAGSARDRVAFLGMRLTGRSSRVGRVLTQLRPDVVHAHFAGDAWLISDAARRAGVPLVVTVHGYDVTRQPAAPGLRGVRYRRNLRLAFDRAALILAVSRFIADRAVELGADPAKVRVHHTGVPIEVGAPAAPPIWDIAFVGRFVEKKGIDDLVEAVGTLAPARPRVLLIGAGPLEAPMRERVARLGLDATFLGFQAPAVVARYLSQSRILACPSKTASNGETEGLPTTILEAASLGVPAVATHHSGIPEAVGHGETGLLCGEGDRLGLARNIQSLLSDEALRDRLGRQARHRVEQRFDLARQTRVLEDLYDSVARHVS